MKASLAYLLPAAASLVVASPLTTRQELEIDLLEAAEPPVIASVPVGPASNTVGYDLPAATQDAVTDPLPVEAVARRSAAAAEKRDACAPQPKGQGPVPSPDTADAFLAAPEFASAAAAANAPPGYYSTFANLKASNNAYGLLGFRTLDVYDAAACAASCDADDHCSGFNLYFERSPTVDPGANCADPPSTTAIKCVWWGGLVNKDNALNDGKVRSNFRIVIAGSNGYMKTRVPAVAGYTGVALGDATINAPLDCNGKDTYMGAKVFTTSFFDPALCTAACEAQNKYNLAHPPAGGKAPKLCKFVTTYLSAKNGQPQGQYCAMYTQPWDKSLAKNTGQFRGTDRYTIGYAFSYSNDASPGLPVCPRDIEYLRTEGADFCTSFIGYKAPATTVSTTTTTFPPQTAQATTTTTVATKIGTTTVTSYFWKRSDAAEVDLEILESIRARPDALVLASVFPNITEGVAEATATPTGNVERRAEGAAVLPTPTSIARWEAASISAACSQVATGTLTVSETSTITSLTTVATVVVSTRTISDITPEATVVREFGPLSRDGRCGPWFGNQHCGGACCSSSYWCGIGDPWCRRDWGCSDTFGVCY